MVLKTIKGGCLRYVEGDAIYEVHLLENGNLQLVAIEDTCGFRSGLFQGAEWAPAPSRHP